MRKLPLHPYPHVSIKVPVAVTLDVNVLPRDIIVNGAVNAKPHVHFAGKGALVHMNLALGGKRARRMIVHVGQPVGSVILNCVGLVMQEGKSFTNDLFALMLALNGHNTRFSTLVEDPGVLEHSQHKK